MNIFQTSSRSSNRDASKDLLRHSLPVEPSRCRRRAADASPSLDQLARGFAALRVPPNAAPAAQTKKQAPLSSAQAEALSARPQAVPVTKLKKAEGASFSYFVLQGPQAPVFRVSKTFARGSSSKLRVALSETQKAFGLMVLHPYGTERTSKKPVQATPFEEMDHVKGLLQRLDSPLQVLDEWVDAKGKVYWRVPLMAMDLHTVALTELTMSPMFQRDSHTLAARLFLFREMASALVPIHEANLVHFDVKLENFLTDGGDRPRVVAADLGLAIAAGVFPAGHPRGTLEYMAPEVLLSNRDGYIDQSSDIFSLGMVVAFMFNSTNTEQYIGKDDDANRTGRTLRQHIFFDLAHMQQGGFTAGQLGQSFSLVTLLETYQELEEADPSVAALVMSRMLSATPEDRPTARQIVEFLDRRIAPEILAEGQRVVAAQIRYFDAVGGKERPIYHIRLLQTAPARPTEEVVS